MPAPGGWLESENVSVCAGRSESVAVAVNVYGASSGIVADAGTPASTGAEFTSVTWRVIDFVSLRAGLPLSVTLTVEVESPGPGASVGVHVKAPVLTSMLAPGGGVSSENASVCVGASESLAVAVSVSAASSGMVADAGPPASTGAEFTSFTWMLIDLVSLSAGLPLSVTLTVNVYSPGPCASAGVQVKTPVLTSMLAPVGGVTSENASVCAGRSASVAVAVNV